jgi:hypothetical protein
MSTDIYSGNHTVKLSSGTYTIESDDIELAGTLDLSSGLTISSGDLTMGSGSISGDLTGDVTGDVTGNVSGNAGTATKLESSVSIGGVSFDGSASITPNAISVTTSTHTSSYVALWEEASGTLSPKTSTSLTCNASTGSITAVQFNGAVVGNVEGNLDGDVTGDVTGNLYGDVIGNVTVKTFPDGSNWGIYDEYLGRFNELGELQQGLFIDDDLLFGIQIDPDTWIRKSDDLLNFEVENGVIWTWPSSSGPIIMDWGSILKLDLDALTFNPIDTANLFEVGGIAMRVDSGLMEIGNVTMNVTDSLSVLDGALTFAAGLGTINGHDWGQDGDSFRMGDLKFNASEGLTLDSGTLLFEGLDINSLNNNILTNVADIAANAADLLDVAALSYNGVTKNLDVTDMETINDIPFMAEGGVEKLGSLRFDAGNNLYLDSGNLKMNGLDVHSSGGMDYIGSHAEFGSSFAVDAAGAISSSLFDVLSTGAVNFANGFQLDTSGDITSAINIGDNFSVAANGSATFGTLSMSNLGALSGVIGDMSIATDGVLGGQFGTLNIDSGNITGSLSTLNIGSAITGSMGDLIVGSTGGLTMMSGAVEMSFSLVSDERIKKNITTIDSGLQKVLDMRSVSYNWSDEFYAARLKPGINEDRLGRKQYGFIAQEIGSIIPELLIDPKEIDPDFADRPLSLDLNGILPFLVSAIQEQQVMIEELQAEVAALKSN